MLMTLAIFFSICFAFFFFCHVFICSLYIFAYKRFPHHFHDQSDIVHSSPLQGDIFADLEIVLPEVLDVIQKQEGI